MLATRIAARVLSRIGIFAFRGFFIGCVCGVAVGAVIGAVLGVVSSGIGFMRPRRFIPRRMRIRRRIVPSPLDYLGMMIFGALGGTMSGAFAGFAVGALTGMVAFGIAGALCSKCNDAKSALNYVTQNVLHPSLWGSGVGAFCVSASASLFGWLTRPNEIMVFMTLGFMGGAFGGFVIGFSYGAISSALAYRKTEVSISSTQL